MKIIKTLRNSSGNSLAEFAVVIALMATLMSTGQVKFSQAGEGGKGKKTGQELDKIMKAANNFYNAMGDAEGAGRFPGQDKWDKSVPLTGAYASLGEVLNDLVGQKFDSYVDADVASTYSGTYGSHWCSVFGKSLVVIRNNPCTEITGRRLLLMTQQVDPKLLAMKPMQELRISRITWNQLKAHSWMDTTSIL